MTTAEYPIDAVIGDINHMTKDLCPGDRRIHLEALYARALPGTIMDAALGLKPPGWIDASTKVLDWLLEELQKPVPDDYTECFMRALLREIHPMMVPTVVDALRKKMASVPEAEIAKMITCFALSEEQSLVVIGQLRLWMEAYDSRRSTRQ